MSMFLALISPPTPLRAAQRKYFGFLYHGDLAKFCDELRTKGVTFPVEPKAGVHGRLLCYIDAPDGVSIEIMQQENSA